MSTGHFVGQHLAGRHAGRQRGIDRLLHRVLLHPLTRAGPCRHTINLRRGGEPRSYNRHGARSGGCAREEDGGLNGERKLAHVHGLREHRPRRQGSAVQAVRAQAGAGATAREGQDHRAPGLRRLEPLHGVQASLPRVGHRADRRPPVALQRQELGGHPDGGGRPRPGLRQDPHRQLRAGVGRLRLLTPGVQAA